jgi:hypothetical protein
MVRLFGAPMDIGARTGWSHEHPARASLANTLLLSPLFAVLLLSLGWETVGIGFVVFATYLFVSIYVVLRWRIRLANVQGEPRYGTKLWHKFALGFVALFVLWIAAAILGWILSS